MKRKPDEANSNAPATPSVPPEAKPAAVPPAAAQPVEPTAAPTPGDTERLTAELAAARETARQLKNRVLELAADLDNQAKRFARERQVVREEIVTRVAREMIEVLDNLDVVVNTLSDAERESPLGHGLVLTHVVFVEKLKSLGVEPIRAEGAAFDPAWHEAMSETPRSDVAPGTVVSELTKGYRLGHRLVRAAKVEIAAAPAAATPAAAPPNPAAGPSKRDTDAEPRNGATAGES